MPVTKVFPEDVDRNLHEVFTRFGYDGASMELLSKATGLKKASLYHRFPGGKRDMAAHVLKNVETYFLDHVQFVLIQANLPIEERLEKALHAISDLFQDKTRNCSLRMLSACSETPYFRTSIARCFTILSDGFTQIAVENGMEESLATSKAMEAIINIQGSLVLSRAMGDNNIFQTSIAAIPQLLGIK